MKKAPTELVLPKGANEKRYRNYNMKVRKTQWINFSQC